MHCAIVPISTIATVFTATTPNQYYRSSHSLAASFNRPTELRWRRSRVPVFRCCSGGPNTSTNGANRERKSSLETSKSNVQEEDADGDEEEDDDGDQSPLFWNSAIFMACLVGLFTGASVVLFNYGVHEIRDLCWDGIPDQGASWLREELIEAKWKRVILVPVLGGVCVSLLNVLRNATEDAAEGTFLSRIRSSLKPVLKAVAACVTLGTGNSLGPEGPSVEIGVSIAKGVGAVFDKGAQRKLSLRAAGSAAGLSSGAVFIIELLRIIMYTVIPRSLLEKSFSIASEQDSMLLLRVVFSLWRQFCGHQLHHPYP